MRWTSSPRAARGPRPTRWSANEAADLARPWLVDDGIRSGSAHLPAAAVGRPRPVRPGPGTDVGLAGVRRGGAPRPAPRRADRRRHLAAAGGGGPHHEAHRAHTGRGPARRLCRAQRPRRERAAHPASAGRPAGPAPRARHPFQRPVLDCGRTPTTVIEHGIVDPGLTWTGEWARAVVVVN